MEDINCYLTYFRNITVAYLPTVPYFPGLYRKYKPCPGVPNVCLKIPDFDGPGYGTKINIYAPRANVTAGPHELCLAS